MKSVIKLKDDARKHELKEDWEKAIQVYREVVRVGEQGEADLELPLYNRIGDLYVRLGRSADAVSFYEQAADRYAEAGLYNNAIALCNKALRYAPDHLDIIRKLGQFSASQGFLTDARRWFIDFAERAAKQGKVDEALTALEDFANISDDADVRELLGRRMHQYGREHEAVAELRRAWGMYVRAGDQERAESVRALLVEIDPDIELDSAAEASAAAPHPHEPPHVEALPAYGEAMPVEEEAPADTGMLEGFEATHVGETAEVADVAGMSVSGLEPTATEPEEPVEALSGLDDVGGIEGPAVDEVDVLEGFEATAFELPELEGETGAGTVTDEEAGAVTERLGTETETGTEAEPEAEAEDDFAFELPMLGEDEEAGAALAEEEHEGGMGFDLPLLGEDAEAAAEAAAAAEAEAEAADFAFELPTLEEPAEEAGATMADEDVAFQLPTFEEPVSDEAGAEDVPLLATDGEADLPAEPVPEVRIEEVEPEADVLAPVRAALDAGDAAEAGVALAALQFRLHGAAAFAEAAELASALVDASPDDVRLHQLRVEFAEQSEDDARRLSAYLDMAAALERTNAPNKARAMYQHVLELDPQNATARAALGTAAQAEPKAASSYVDLASLIDVDQPTGDTRYFVEETEPTGDEDRDFAELLAQFKAKVSENVSMEDAGAHYDLGLAFKEMGLIDEAIGEFQIALRAGDERLKIYEELGQCFMMKEQYNVATKVFGRALRMPHDDELELIGVYYHLGRALEQLGRPAEARDAYERVMTLDINFQDVSSRLARL